MADSPLKRHLLATLRPVARWLVKRVFRAEVIGAEHFEKAGPGTLVVCNHVSYLDGFLLYLLLPRPLAFAINTDAAAIPQFRLLLWFPDLFILDPFNPLAAKQVIAALKRGETVGIFPEGRLSADGGLMKVYDGPALIADKANATILPVGIAGTEFSRMTRLAGKKRQRLFPKVRITIQPPRRLELSPALGGSARREAGGRQIEKLMREIVFHNHFRRETFPAAMLRAARQHGGNRVLLEDLDRKPLSYRSLFTRSTVLGALLRRHTRYKERVGVLLPGSCGCVITVLALMQTSRVPAMLNFAAGQRALREACETGQLKRVLTSRRFVEKAELGPLIEALSEHVEVLMLEDLRAELTFEQKVRGLLVGRFPSMMRQLGEFPKDPDAEALVLFTSGSESTAKGVVLSHANLLANRAQVKPFVSLTYEDRLFCMLPLFHTFGILAGIVLPLLDGARVFLYPTPLHYRQIPEFCYALGTTVLFGTNTFFNGYGRSAHPYDFHTLRLAVAGAEALRENTRALWADKFGVRILEGYGATEASPVVAVNALSNPKKGTVGELLPMIEHRLLPVEGIEEGGRLAIRGPNVMLGYLIHGDDGRLHPPATDDGPGWLDLGDIVTMDDSGHVRIAGRARRFAKVGGEMVSLAKVEELALAVWPDHQHAAMTRPDDRRGEEVILLTTCPDPLRSTLAAGARERDLPELLVPREVITVAEVPVLASGKTDYRALAEQYAAPAS